MILSGVKITKQNETYDTYRVEISMGQLLSIRDALRSSHASPEADEMLKEIDWYLAQLPGPGETKDDMEAAKNGAPAQPNIEDVDIDVALPDPNSEPIGGEADVLAAGDEGGPEGEAPVEDEVPLEAPA